HIEVQQERRFIPSTRRQAPINFSPKMRVAEGNHRVEAEYERDNDDKAEVAGQCPDHERQIALGTGQERVENEFAIALRHPAPYPADELGIAFGESPG
ncbi:unnamed protein product, partial [marine sediment metagenome]